VRRGARIGEQGGWLIAQDYGDTAAERARAASAVGLADISAVGVLDLKGGGLDGLLPDLPTVPAGSSVAVQGVRVIRLTDRHAWLLAAPVEIGALRERLAAGLDGAVTDLTGGLCVLRLLGPASPAVLERLCALDLAADRFADGRAAQGSVAGVHALIARRDGAVRPGYDLFVTRDLGLYLWGAVLEAGGPLGLGPIGYEAAEEQA
jgi:aminomethyltransferase